MRKILAVTATVALLAGAATFVGFPGFATAQGGGGTVEVEVKYNGAPVIEKIKINKDTEKCGTEAKQEKIVVGPNKGLANAVVTFPGAKGSAKPKKATLDQKGCEYQPHVVAMQAGGEIDILNSDGILHNVKSGAGTANPAFNESMPKTRTKPVTKKFDKPEVIRVECSVHSWMLGYVSVAPNELTGVTDGSGVSKIENVPAGKHKVDVWHETLGKQSKEVDVKAGQTTKVSFEMKK
jgi:plastocyanin